MKKIKILFFSILLISYILFNPLEVQAATIDINMKTETKNYTITDENNILIVTIELGDFINLPEEEPLGFSGELEFDSSIFEEIKVEGINGWNASFNNENNMVVGDVAKAKANTQIAKISLKINAYNVSNMENTTIGLKNLIITDGEFEIVLVKQISIKLENNISQNENTNNNDTQKITNIKEVTLIKPEETVASKGQEVNSLPNTGLRKNIIITIIGVVILSIIFKIKSRKIKY